MGNGEGRYCCLWWCWWCEWSFLLNQKLEKRLRWNLINIKKFQIKFKFSISWNGSCKWTFFTFLLKSFRNKSIFLKKVLTISIVNNAYIDLFVIWGAFYKIYLLLKKHSSFFDMLVDSSRSFVFLSWHFSHPLFFFFDSFKLFIFTYSKINSLITILSLNFFSMRQFDLLQILISLTVRPTRYCKLASCNYLWWRETAKWQNRRWKGET